MANKILLLVTVQDLSANALPCYGGLNAKSSELDKMVIKGTVFDSHYSRCLIRQSDEGSKFQKKLTTFEADSSEISPYQKTFTKAKKDGVNTFRCSLGKLSEEASFDNEVQKLKDDFEETHLQSDPLFVWIELESNDLSRLDTLLQCLQSLLENHCNASTETIEITWLITGHESESIIPSDESFSEKEYSSLYSEALKASMSFQLRRPLILILQGHENAVAQRVSDLTSTEDVCQAIELFFCSKPEFELQTETNSLFSLSKIDQSKSPSENQFGVFQGDNQTGLRTTTDLTVVPESIEELKKTVITNWPIARYYLKPEDQYDTNDLATSFPDVVYQRLETLQAILNKS